MSQELGPARKLEPADLADDNPDMQANWIRALQREVQSLRDHVDLKFDRVMEAIERIADDRPKRKK